MPSRNPDFATLASEEAYKAVDKLLEHLTTCGMCMFTTCNKGKRLISSYRTKKDKALKAIRGKK